MQALWEALHGGKVNLEMVVKAAFPPKVRQRAVSLENVGLDG
jgi:hypothetical protein